MSLTLKDAVAVSRARRLGRSGMARKIRERAGLSLRELAEFIGEPPSSLCRWERGEVTPRAAKAVRWGRALDVLEEINGGEAVS